MNILYILPTLFRGGAEKSTLYLASRMQFLGNTVSLLAIRGGGSLVNDFQACGIRVSVRKKLREQIKELLPQRGLDLFYRAQRRRYRVQYAQRVKLSPPKRDPSLERWVKQKVCSIAPDVVHVHQSLCVETLRWAKECGVAKVVYSPHEMTGEISDDDDIRRINEYIVWADWVTFVSYAQRKDFLQHIPYRSEQTSVIYPQTAFVGALVIGKHTPPPLIVGTMSNLSPPKDPMTLLQALDVLCREGRDVRVLIAGGDPRWRPAIEETVRDLNLHNRVRFLGPLETDSEIHAFFDAIDLYVSTSVSESFGLAVKEAMECGIAVVSSDVQPVSELVDKGRTGLIFRRGDVEDLASKFRYFLDHPVKVCEMGQRGRKRLSTKFSADRTIAQYQKIYEQSLRK